MDSTRVELPKKVTALAPCRIGAWDVYPDQGRLSRNGDVIRIEPRAMHLLACLAARPGEVVPHDELLAVVWWDAVVAEGAISRTISELRRDLGDDARSPQYIETIYKRGYRLLATVTPLPTVTPRRRLRRSVLAIALILALAVVGIAVSRRSTPPPTGGPAFLTGIPLTTTPGIETAPDLSADGTQVAFCRRDQGRTDEDIYVVPVSGGSPQLVIGTPMREMRPVWSPDGRELAFVRLTEELEVVVATVADKSERVVATFPRWIWGMDWSPDGTRLVIATPPVQGAPARTVQIELETGRVVPVFVPAPATSDRAPRYSPDGRRLAFLRTTDEGGEQIFVADLPSAIARPITEGGTSIAGLDWTADGRFIMTTMAGLQGYEMRRLNPEDGSQQILPVAAGHPHALTVARETGSLVYEEVTIDIDILGLRLVDGSGPPRAEPVSLPALTSTRLDYSARFSPDGQRIAFASGRSGKRQIWLSDQDGGNCRQLSHFNGSVVERVRWSPDGDQIACQVYGKLGPALAIVDAASGEHRVYRINADRFEGWSAAGDAVIVIRDLGPDGELWRLPLGDEEPVFLARNVVGFVHENVDGTVYYRRYDEKDIRAKGPSERLDQGRIAFPGEQLGDWISGTLRDGSLYVVSIGAENHFLTRHEPGAARVDTLAALRRGTGTELSVAPDGRDFLMQNTSRNERDLILVKEY
jgi:Tol biopolymer transport system component/DNA-binding winged helix-turn-helix (wHTH) protein